MLWSQYEEQATGDHIIVGHDDEGIVLEPAVVIRVEHAEEEGHDKRSQFAYRLASLLASQ